MKKCDFPFHRLGPCPTNRFSPERKAWMNKWNAWFHSLTADQRLIIAEGWWSNVVASTAEFRRGAKA